MAADPFSTARRNMIERQLVPANIVRQSIVEALASVPREQFMPEELRGSAYVDGELEVAKGRYLLSPLTLARLLTLAEIDEKDKVLDIGCATGYSTAVISLLSAMSVALECDTEMAEKARKLLARLHTPNAEVHTGPLQKGWPAKGTYDLIFINGAVEILPDALAEQLSEGGRIVAVHCIARRPGGDVGLGEAVVSRKSGGRLFHRRAFEISVPGLAGFEKKREFEF